MLVLLGFGFIVGVLVGWVWKPKWASFALHTCKFQYSGMAFIPSSPVNNQSSTNNPHCSSSIVTKEENHLLKDEDLKHLWHLVEKRDVGPPWKHMMDCSTPNMHYQAWQRDPETGPPQYCSKTVYENATPELMRDFFWDDDFRLKWDDMLLHAATLEEFPITGTSVVHWIRKFPFFCSDREYTIARRIWELGRSYYCVTKGVPCPSVPRKQKPRRVDLYYSSWFIKSVESKNGSEKPACEVTFFHHEDMGTYMICFMTVESKNGSEKPACEVTFFHHEDMGIPWEIAKFGVRQGMWGAAKKVERGFRLYQNERAFTKTISSHVVMAQMSTKIDGTHLTSLESDKDQDEQMTETKVAVRQEKQAMGMKVPKLLVFGGAVMVACSIDRGLLTKAAIFGVAKRFASIGSQAGPRR